MAVMPGAKAGICIIRIEPEADRLLISVMTTRHLNRDLYSMSAEPSLKFAEPERAIAAVAEFIRSYT